MKQLPQIHEFDPQIYPVKLWIVKNPTEDYIHDNFEEADGSKLNFNIKSHYAMCCYTSVIVRKGDKSFGVLISTFHKPTTGFIAHESTHAARFIWDWLEEGETGREADAYLVGWIADCCEKVIKNKSLPLAQI